MFLAWPLSQIFTGDMQLILSPAFQLAWFCSSVASKYAHIYWQCLITRNDACFEVQGGSNMTGTNCYLFTHKSSRSYLNHFVLNSCSLSLRLTCSSYN
jgi:hypothetical protein